jgi:hypothetical protein
MVNVIEQGESKSSIIHTEKLITRIFWLIYGLNFTHFL